MTGHVSNNLFGEMRLFLASFHYRQIVKSQPGEAGGRIILISEHSEHELSLDLIRNSSIATMTIFKLLLAIN
jgi:hypothetical protein